MKKRKVAVIGCMGKMGQVTCRALLSSHDYELAAGFDVTAAGEDLGQMLNVSQLGITISNNLQKGLNAAAIDVAIDFTNPQSVTSNVAQCLQAKVPVVVGTSGLPIEDREKISHLSEKMDTPVLIVPNFAIGAILMMEFSKKAAQYFPNVEIIEMHHPQKLDKPSGTANMTRELLGQALNKTEADEKVPVHSVRLPGLTAHQEVIFGGLGQLLTIRHDSFNRDSFMPGLFLALKQVFEVKGLKIGLEI
ncbi:MAG: 4-hydroxy-tetrahydrodipicolinate reductase [Candidatus Riflebacteria bacterium]|nr:4-hydroxy-tetrahydrodipicolinate reductase [Candidatus Riflebacteria bacterium]